ncbi:endo-1,3-alpha-glucanase family glycosylhydrolase [Kiritimatiellaeota bacterium B1221]|nr:endo-1,3-alpha-glucanase family glycosylhydrolase [Kiritimatiellaeota bacterium B1221]
MKSYNYPTHTLRATLLLSLGLLLSSCQTSKNPSPASPRVLAHYMPWFQMETAEDGYTEWSHWQWFGKGPKHDPDEILENGQRDIASVFYPLIGPYDGRDPAVLEYQLLSARAAGIEGFIVDWYGPGTYSDITFAALLDMAEELEMQVAICLEEKAFFPPYSKANSREEVLEEAARHIRHIQQTHATSPAYLHQEGRPVFYIFLGHEEGRLGPNTLSPEEVRDVLKTVESPRPFLYRPHWDPAYAGVTDGAFAWCGDLEYRSWFYPTAQDQLSAGTLTTFTGVASPGFDDSGVWGWGNGPRFTDRRDGEEYRENWKEVLAANPPAVQIVTWNDFEEGTTIEPTLEYGFTYLNMTEEFIAEYTGRTSELSDNTAAHFLYQLRIYLRNNPDPALSKQLDAQREAWVKGTPPPVEAWRERTETLLQHP